MAEEDVHQRGLARAILAEQRHHLAAREAQAHRVIRGERPEALGDAVKAQDDVRRRACPGHDALGSLSSTVTVKLPALIAASFSATSASAAAGTLPSKVPSGARLQPPWSIVE